MGSSQNPGMDAATCGDGDGASPEKHDVDNPLPSRAWTIEHVRSNVTCEHVPQFLHTLAIAF